VYSVPRMLIGPVEEENTWRRPMAAALTSMVTMLAGVEHPNCSRSFMGNMEGSSLSFEGPEESSPVVRTPSGSSFRTLPPKSPVSHRECHGGSNVPARLNTAFTGLVSEIIKQIYENFYVECYPMGLLVSIGWNSLGGGSSLRCKMAKINKLPTMHTINGQIGRCWGGVGGVACNAHIKW
jgi:hypothetical protein